MVRAADLGLTIGILPSGPTGSVLDVPGVGVGHATVWRDEPPPPAGRGIARTGVTVLDPGGSLFRSPVPAGGAVLNGAGECTGFLAAGEWGLAETPVFLTSTMQVGRVYDAACELLMEEDAGIGVDDVIIPIVAECDDSFLSDARRMQVTRADVRTALNGARASAGGPAAPFEGAVGAGTGMTCLGYKGGIGTASRRLPASLGGYTVGVLVQTNFGGVLTISGAPVGQALGQYYLRQELKDAGSVKDKADGSCMIVIATDAPMEARNLKRLAARAWLGVARTGSSGSNGSGDYAIAFSTAAQVRIHSSDRALTRNVDVMTNDAMSPLFMAAIEATEEAVYNSMFKATTMTGNGHTVEALPIDKVVEILKAHRVIK